MTKGELILIYFANISRQPILSLLRSQNSAYAAYVMGRRADQKDLMSLSFWSCGVEHGDARPSNVLWNPESKKVMLVDFERSES